MKCSERERGRGSEGASLVHACVSGSDSDGLAPARLSIAQFLLGLDKEVGSWPAVYIHALNPSEANM